MGNNLGSFLDSFAAGYAHAQNLKDQREQRAWERSLMEQKFKFEMESQKFEAQMKLKQFEMDRQVQMQHAKMEEQRGKEQHFNNLLDATTSLMSTRQTALGYGEDTSALDRAIGSMSQMGGF